MCLVIILERSVGAFVCFLLKRINCHLQSWITIFYNIIITYFRNNTQRRYFPWKAICIQEIIQHLPTNGSCIFKPTRIIMYNTCLIGAIYLYKYIFFILSSFPFKVE